MMDPQAGLNPEEEMFEDALEEGGTEDSEDVEHGHGDEPSTSEPSYGCSHYRRKCRIVAPCCGQVFWCRWCHNAAMHDNEQDERKRHMLDRKAVEEVVCACCDTRQPVSPTCTQCGASFGKYNCMRCKFFDDDVSKNQFHCEGCGICRVGGRENYFHCRVCNCCYSIELRESHVCIENSMHHACSVCVEFLFDSVKQISVMRCGHTIHQECLKSLFEHGSYSCPECSKSILAPDTVARMNEEMDSAVRATPMPPEYADVRVAILCNDCGQRSSALFHVLGHKCAPCGGYNTRRI